MKLFLDPEQRCAPRTTKLSGDRGDGCCCQNACYAEIVRTQPEWSVWRVDDSCMSIEHVRWLLVGPRECIRVPGMDGWGIHLKNWSFVSFLQCYYFECVYNIPNIITLQTRNLKRIIHVLLPSHNFAISEPICNVLASIETIGCLEPIACCRSSVVLHHAWSELA